MQTPPPHSHCEYTRGTQGYVDLTVPSFFMIFMANVKGGKWPGILFHCLSSPPPWLYGVISSLLFSVTVSCPSYSLPQLHILGAYIDGLYFVSCVCHCCLLLIFIAKTAPGFSSTIYSAFLFHPDVQADTLVSGPTHHDHQPTCYQYLPGLYSLIFSCSVGPLPALGPQICCVLGMFALPGLLP